MVDEMKILPKEEREQLMKDANFSVYVPPEQGLGLKADLCIPWKNLRMMKRYKMNVIQARNDPK